MRRRSPEQHGGRVERVIGAWKISLPADARGIQLRFCHQSCSVISMAAKPETSFLSGQNATTKVADLILLRESSQYRPLRIGRELVGLVSLSSVYSGLSKVETDMSAAELLICPDAMTWEDK